MPTARRVARSVSSFGRIAVAISVLLLLWYGTVKTVERGSRVAEQRRSADRVATTNGFATSVRDWLQAGQSEATALGRSVGASNASDVAGELNSFLAQPKIFTRNALVFSGGTVVAASGRYAALTGLHPNACVRAGQAMPNDLDRLVSSAGATPVTSSIFDVPGACSAATAIAVGTGPYTAVVVGDLNDLDARLDGASSDGMRITLVTPGLSVDPHAGIVSAPPYATSFAQDVAAGGPAIRHETSGDQSVVAAIASVKSGWSVVLEQDASVFDIPPQDRPAVIVASVLTIVFAVVFALIAFFDIRRRRAHRRAEVAKNAFFSITGHELRTPLTALNGFTDMLSQHWDDLDDERRHTLVDRMAPQARRLGRLVERLLVAASIQAETHTRPQLEEMDPVPSLRRVAAQFAVEAPLHSLIVDARPGPIVLADPEAFEEVMRHLVENAIKYSPSGGRVWIRSIPDDRVVHIVVDDEGIGLPSNHRRIFDNLVQGESVTTRVHDEGGVGVGLFIVRTLVSDMRGVVRAEPREEGGARFVVTLRRSRAHAPSQPLDRELVTTVQPRISRARQKS
jgi:signal transduction histidine kinase